MTSSDNSDSDQQQLTNVVPKGRVLIAEDEPVFRRVITFTLERAGFEVVAVVNGEQAWEALRANQFDALVTDHQMPGGSGIDLLEKIREAGMQGECPTILCTAKGLELDSEYLSQRFQLTSILHKPFSPQKLAQMLTECCCSAGETC